MVISILIKCDASVVNGKLVLVWHWPKTTINRVFFYKERNDHKFNSQHFQISAIVKRQHAIYIAFINHDCCKQSNGVWFVFMTDGAERSGA